MTDKNAQEQQPVGEYSDVSIDLETLSLDPRAVVLSIGAVAFNREGLGPSYRHVLDRRGQEMMNRHVSQSTREWWDELQGSSAHTAVFGVAGVAVSAALFELSQFIQGLRGVAMKAATPRLPIRLWAKGGKDFTWLETLYEDMGHVVPWHYRDAMDYRSLVAITEDDVVLGLDRDAEGIMDRPSIGGRVPHEALNDAQFQAHFLRGLLTLKGYWKLSR